MYLRDSGDGVERMTQMRWNVSPRVLVDGVPLTDAGLAALSPDGGK